jgi:hypothetical protein
MHNIVSASKNKSMEVKTYRCLVPKQLCCWKKDTILLDEKGGVKVVRHV